MKILAIDVGTGTQDILIYDDEKEHGSHPDANIYTPNTVTYSGV